MRGFNYNLKKEDVVTFRMLHRDHLILIDTAAYHGISKGDFIRRCVNAFLRNSQNDKTTTK